MRKIDFQKNFDRDPTAERWCDVYAVTTFFQICQNRRHKNDTKTQKLWWVRDPFERVRATWGHRSRGDRFRAPCGNFEFAQNHRLHRTLRSKTRFHFCMGNLTFTLEILQLAKVGFRWFSMFPSPGGPNARISAGKTHTMCARLAQGENPPGAGRTPAGALKLPGSRAPLGRRGIPLGKSGFPGVPRA